MADAKLTSASGTHYTFIRLQGSDPEQKGDKLEEITRPGLDGHAFRAIGKRMKPLMLRGTVDVDKSSTTVEARMATYKGLEGTLLTFTSEAGDAYESLMLLQVTHINTMQLDTMVGGVGGANADTVLVVEFLLQPTKVS